MKNLSIGKFRGLQQCATDRGAIFGVGSRSKPSKFAKLHRSEIGYRCPNDGFQMRRDLFGG